MLEVEEKIPNNGNTRIRRIIANSENVRQEIFNSLCEAVKNKFPVSGQKYTASVSNVVAAPVMLSHSEEKTTLLAKGNKTSGIYCDLHITDNKTGKEVKVLKKYRIMSVPYYTHRGTMIVDGNEYAVVSQMRTKSGVYTRKRGNEEIESAFNLAKGANFKMIMNPDTGQFKIDMLGSIMPASAILKILGAKPEDLSNAIGTELLASNRCTDSQLEKARNFLYNKLVNYRSDGQDVSTAAEKEEKIRAYFAGTKMDPETTKITLGTPQTSVSASTILTAMKKIIAVYKGTEDVDERDFLEFQKVYSVEDLLKEVIDKNSDIVPKIQKILDSDTPEKISSSIFSQPIRSFIGTSSLARLPTQINPVEFVDTSSIITRLGEGGISTERAVPFTTRGVSYSSAGLIDPVPGPESNKIGIDVHATINAAKGTDNEFYKKVTNMQTKQIEYKRAIDLFDKRVGYPDPKYVRDADKKPFDRVYCVHRGKLERCTRKELDYQISDPADLCTYTTNNIPFMPNNQGNRLLMGAKHVVQALPLENPDTRLVKSVFNAAGESASRVIANYTTPKAPENGTVKKVDNEYIYIKGDSGTLHKIDYENDLPLATKTFLTNKVMVKPGDKVEQNQPLAESNFSKNGDLALGKNLRCAYMPYHGWNHEDGVVMSESAAHKMRSVHAEKIFVDIDKTTIVNKAKYTAAFPTNFTKAQLDNIDASGVVKVGTALEAGDPLILAMKSNMDSRINQVLGKLSKALMHPYTDIAERYEEAYEAEVVGASVTKSSVSVVLKIHRDLQVGDKVSGSYGNKGVCAKILPDSQMPHDETGRPLDILLTSAGVISRINPAQTLETALGKVADRTGKTYSIENFSKPDAVEFVKNELRKNNVKEKENLYDPITGKTIPNVFTGVQHFYKLFKTTDSNYAARNFEGQFDQDEAPSGSGEEAPKAMGTMEVGALLASNTRALLREGTMLRASKNSEFWKAFQQGITPNFPNEKKVFTRFTAMLKQAGINVTRQGNNLVAAPLTDADITKLSNGEVTDARRLEARTMNPEADGLFDARLFGGIKGDRWAHINLAEPVLNPCFKDAARYLLGVNTAQLNDMCINEGGAAIKQKLNAIDVNAELAATENQLRNGALKASQLDTTVKKLKCLRALKENGTRAGDAYVLTKFPVTPPIYRPISIGDKSDIMESDANTLYRDLILQNNSFKEIQGMGLGSDTLKENRKALNTRLAELTGKIAPSDIVSKNRGIKGALDFISGDVPKHGFFQGKVIYNKMGMSGRFTISPDNTLGLDEVGLPVDAAWKMYKPLIVRDMTRLGYSLADAEDAVEERNETAKKILDEKLEQHPVVVNRAPTLWKYNMFAAKPVLRDGKNLRLCTIVEKGIGGDYDGDAVNVHLPVTDEAVADAKKLFPSQNVFNDKKKNALVQYFTNEPVAALYKATTGLGEGKAGPAHRYATEQQAWADFYAGKLKLTDYVVIG